VVATIDPGRPANTPAVPHDDPTRFSSFLRLWVLLRLDADDIVVGDLDRIPRLEFVATSPIDGQDHAARPVHPNDFAVPPVHGGDHGLPPTFKNQKWR